MTSSMPSCQDHSSAPTRRSTRARSPPKKISDNAVTESQKISIAKLTLNFKPTSHTSKVDQTNFSMTRTMAIKTPPTQCVVPEPSKMVVLRYTHLKTETDPETDPEYTSEEEMISQHGRVNREMEEAAWILNQMKRRITFYTTNTMHLFGGHYL